MPNLRLCYLTSRSDILKVQRACQPKSPLPNRSLSEVAGPLVVYPGVPSPSTCSTNVVVAILYCHDGPWPSIHNEL